MSNFKTAHLEGYEIKIVSIFDPGASLVNVSPEAYMDEPYKYRDCVKALTPAVPIYCHPARKEEIGLALDEAGFEMKDGEVLGSEEFSIASKDAKAMQLLARLCIEEIRGLDGWGDLPTTHDKMRAGMRMLSEDVINLIPTHLQGPILVEVGRHLFQRRSALTEDRGRSEDSSVLEHHEGDGEVREQLPNLSGTPTSPTDTGVQ